MIKSLEFKISLISLVIVPCTAPQSCPTPAPSLGAWKGNHLERNAKHAPRLLRMKPLSSCPLRDSLASWKLETVIAFPPVCQRSPLTPWKTELGLSLSKGDWQGGRTDLGFPAPAEGSSKGGCYLASGRIHLTSLRLLLPGGFDCEL